MKKYLISLILCLFLSISVFADGDSPGGGKPCPNPAEPCRIATEPTTEDPIIKVFADIIIGFLI